MLLSTFTDTIFLKKSSNLQKKYESLLKLLKEYPNNEKLQEEFYFVKKGFEGENEIRYQLSKSNLGLFVLSDINIQYEDLTAQIDYVVLSKAYCYFIECKNLVGNITVNDKGDFIREYTFNNKKIKKGMYSPLRQVEAQIDVYKKIWNNRLSKNKIINYILRTLSEKNFEDNHRVLVVAANSDTILNTNYAPKDMKYKIIRSDALIRQIKYDLDHSDKTLWLSKSEQEKWANTFLNINIDTGIDYYSYYKNKYVNSNEINKSLLKEELINFRKNRSNEMNIPAYYIFTNNELEKIIEQCPRTLEKLKELNILENIKIKVHGEKIIEVINNQIKNN